MSESPHEQRDIAAKAKIIDEAIEVLKGHFDAVIIIGTFQTEDGVTITQNRRDGNWHAQNGMMQYLLKKRLAEADLDAKKEFEEREGEESA